MTCDDWATLAHLTGVSVFLDLSTPFLPNLILITTNSMIIIMTATISREARTVLVTRYRVVQSIAAGDSISGVGVLGDGVPSDGVLPLT